MKKSLLLTLIFFSGYFLLDAQVVRTWVATSNSNANSAANWNGGVTVPTSLDTVVFDGTSTFNCNWDLGSSVATVKLLSGYSGVVTWTSGRQFRNSLIIRSGTFTSPSGTGTLIKNATGVGDGMFEVSGTGTFNHSSGIVVLGVEGAESFSFSGNISLNILRLADALNVNSERTIDFGSNLSVNQLNYSGVSTFDPINFLGTVHIKTSMNFSSFTPGAAPVGANSASFIFDGSSATLTGPSSFAPCYLPNVEINTTGTYGIVGELPVSGDWLRTAGTLSSGSSNVYLLGTSKTISGNASFDNLIVETGASYANTSANTINVTDTLKCRGTLSMANTSTVVVGADMINTGAITANTSCSLNVAGNYTCTGGITIGDNSKINVTGAMSGAGAISAGNSCSLTAAGNYTCDGGITAGTNATVNIGSNLSGTGLITAGNASTLIVVGSYTAGGGLTLGSTCSVNVGSNLLGTGAVSASNDCTLSVANNYTNTGGLSVGATSTVNVGAALTGAGAVTTANAGTLNVVGAYTAGGGLNLGTNSKATVGGALVGTGAIVMASTSTLNVTSDLTISSGLTIGASSSLTVGGDLIRNAACTANTTSTLTLNGSGASQNISGSSALDIGVVNLATNATRNITVSGGGLSILDALEIGNNVTFNTGGLLGLESTNALTARVGQLGSGSSISGNANKKTVIPGGTTGWANLGAPGIAGQTIASWDTYIGTGSTGIPMMCTGCTYDPASTGSWFKSIHGWDEANCFYDTTLTQSSALTPGKGFWVYVGDGTSTTSDLAVIDFGAIVQGTQPVTLTKLSSCSGDLGSNLVANPYPSPISWTGFCLANGTSTTNLTNGYFSWNANANAYAQFVGGTGINGGKDTIAAGQGFYLVVTTGSGGTFNFTEACKVSGNTSTSPLLRQANDVGQIFKLALKSPNAGESDETAFRLHQDATFGYDRAWDMQKYFVTPGYVGYPGAYSKYSTISSRDAQSMDYGIQSIPVLTGSISIPVLVKVSGPGSYTISPQDVAQLSGCVILRDKLSNINHDLKTGSYVFTISDTTSSPRFELLLCKESNPNPNSILEYGLTGSQVKVGHDANGTFVNTHFATSTKAVISVYNIVGQKIAEDIMVEGAETSTRINTGSANQVVFVKVTTPDAVYTRKILSE